VKVPVKQLRQLGWTWPPHDAVGPVPDDGVIDLDEAADRVQQSLGFHQREQDDIYAFAARWNADIDDTTDRRYEVAGNIEACRRALHAIREIVEALSASPPRRKPEPKRPKPITPPPPMTANELAAAAERERLPNRTELAELLAIYFVDATDDAIDRLDREMREVERDDRKRGDLRYAWYASSENSFTMAKFHGQLWLEREWDGDKHGPSGRTLALYAAARLPEFPRPRGYCPELFVGTWTQVAPAAGTWRLDSDGFATIDTTSPVPPQATWAIHLAHRHGHFHGAELHLFEPGSRSRQIYIDRVTTTRVAAHRLGLDGAIEYVLERPAAPPPVVEPGAVLARRYRLEELVAADLYTASVLDGGHVAQRVLVRVLADLDAAQRARALDRAGQDVRSRFGGAERVGDIEWRVDEGEPCLLVMEDLRGYPTLADLGTVDRPRAYRLGAKLADSVRDAILTPHGRLRASDVFVVPDRYRREDIKIVGRGLPYVLGELVESDDAAVIALIEALVGSPLPPELKTLYMHDLAKALREA
jgi:hypothetical protein